MRGVAPRGGARFATLWIRLSFLRHSGTPRCCVGSSPFGKLLVVTGLGIGLSIQLGIEMSEDQEDQIQQAIEAGQKNLQTMKLIRNWCANAKVVKHGGTGLIEMQTGLPIGHHFIECPYAPAGGMAAWDLADTAIDFYDRNCADCKVRKPVGFPNISGLIAERDEKRKAREAEQVRYDKVRADRLTAREQQRNGIRQKLTALQAATLDQISELDSTRSDEAAIGLVELSELAPETFAPAIVEHLFDTAASGEHWLVEPSLQTLRKLSPDPKRLCDLALSVLQSYSAIETAAAIVEENADKADSSLIEGALPALIRLAHPMHTRFGIGAGHEKPNIGPFRSLFLEHPDAVKVGLKNLLESTDPWSVRTAACGIAVVTNTDTTEIKLLARELVGKLARAQFLIQGRKDDVDDALDDVRAVLVRAFLRFPDEIDALIAQYLDGATDKSSAELYQIYVSVVSDLRPRRYDGKPAAITTAHRLAFRRVVVLATEPNGREVENVLASLFHGNPYELTPLAAEKIGLLLGSAAVLKTKLDELQTSQRERADASFLLSQMSRSSYLNNLLHCYVRWACIAAGRAGVSSIQEVLDFMRALPEKDDLLRGAIVGNFDCMMRSVDTLSQCLPDYYSALVGSSQLVRSNAATALGEMNAQIREHLPTLVFEAFVAFLTDPFTIVHKAAVRALERFTLPDSQNNHAALALWNLIACYAQDRSDDDFLMKCIGLFVDRHVGRELLADQLGNTLIDIMMRVRPWSVAREIRHWGHHFEGNPNYLGLLLHLMNDDEAMYYQHDELFDRLRSVPVSMLYDHRRELVELSRRASRHRSLHEAGFILEALTACGAWREAAEASIITYNSIEDNVREKPRRLRAKLRKIACELELAVSLGKTDEVEKVRIEWDQTIREVKDDNEIHRLRRDPLRGLLDKN